MLPRRHLPNALTLLRLVFAAAFFAALEGYRYPDVGRGWGNAALALFVLAAVTDALDGALARRWNVVSAFGRIMDPFCDKVLVLGAFVYLTGSRFLFPDDSGTIATAILPWMVVVILARELLVTTIRGVAEAGGTTFGANWSGKAKMILQSIAIPVVLFLVINVPPHLHAWSRWTIVGLVWITLLVTLWSGLPYLTGARKVMAKTPGAERSPDP